MDTLFIILVVLFLALFIIVPLIEKFGPSYSKEETSKIWRWVFPLLGILMLVQALRYFFQ